MAKRFTATDIWDKPWFRGLPTRLKAFWSYVKDRCDPAGVWQGDFALASFCIGESITQEDMEHFKEQIEKLPCGKWWLKNYVRFQYKQLSTDCKPHLPVFESLERHSISLDRLGLSKGSIRVRKAFLKASVTVKDKDKDKDEDKDKDKDKDKDRERVQGEGCAKDSPFHKLMDEYIRTYTAYKPGDPDPKQRTAVTECYKRYGRAGRQLLALALGDAGVAIAGMSAVASRMDSRGLSYTLETVCEHFPDWHSDPKGYEYETEHKRKVRA